MWKKLKSSSLFLSYSNEFEIYVTDYITLWCSYFSKLDFISSLKENNRLLEMSDEALLQKGLQILSNPDIIKSLDTKHDGTSLLINMTMQFGYPFKLALKLTKGSNELFFCILTQPLLKTVMELKNSQSELCQLLIKKDSEIEEYKCEGGEIALKHLKTKPFNKEAFTSKYLSFEEHFGTTNNVINDLIHTVLKTPEESIKRETLETTIKLEDHKIKIEESKNSTFTNSNLQNDHHLKVEANTSNMSIKRELSTQIITPKVESSSQMLDSETVSRINGMVSVKQEPEITTKRELQSLPKHRTKIKKLF